METHPYACVILLLMRTRRLQAEAAADLLEQELERRRAALRQATQLQADKIEQGVIDDVASRAQSILAGGSGDTGAFPDNW